MSTDEEIIEISAEGELREIAKDGVRIFQFSEKDPLTTLMVATEVPKNALWGYHVKKWPNVKIKVIFEIDSESEPPIKLP
jgi:hypothetical protein